MPLRLPLSYCAYIFSLSRSLLRLLPALQGSQWLVAPFPLILVLPFYFSFLITAHFRAVIIIFYTALILQNFCSPKTHNLHLFCIKMLLVLVTDFGNCHWSFN